KMSNFRHRPLAIGIQGLADLFIALGFLYESDEAFVLNREIFETMYFAALTASWYLAKHHGPFPSFENSPISQGILQFDMWENVTLSGRWDWDSLRADIKKWGVRNSLLIGPMPTASTSQILGNNE